MPYIFLIVSIVVPALVYVVTPWVVSQLGGNAKRSKWLLITACLLFMVSWHLPSPLIEGRDTSFTTHFVGGGLFSGLLWVYLKCAFSWRSYWWLEAFSLFALVSALGAANELFEWFIVYAGIFTMALDDTSWDIVANTLGASVAYIGYLLYDSRHR